MHDLDTGEKAMSSPACGHICHDGMRVSFDTICRGHREIVEIDMTRLNW